MKPLAPGRARDRYAGFDDLAAAQREGIDFRVRVVERPASQVAIIAPHGGSIERRTTAIARALAGAEFNLYLFEGLDDAGSFDVLHITSHRFDEPRCLRLVQRCSTVIAVHGCAGDEPGVMLGGRDRALGARLASALQPLAIAVRRDGHPYPGTHRRNICNRGASGRGVQLELSDALRGAAVEQAVVRALRGPLLAADRARAPTVPIHATSGASRP